MAVEIGNIFVRDVSYRTMFKAYSLSACDTDVFWFICSLQTDTVF